MPTGKGGASVDIAMSRRIKGFLSLYTLVRFHLIDAVGIIANKDIKNAGKVSENIRAIFGAIYNHKRKVKVTEMITQAAAQLVGRQSADEDAPFDVLTDNPAAGSVFRTAEVEAVKATLEAFVENATPFVRMLSETDPNFGGIADMETKFKNIIEGSGNPYCHPSIIVTNNKAEAEKVLRGYQENNVAKLLKMRGICAAETKSDARSSRQEDAEKIGKAIAVKLLDGLYLELIIKDGALPVAHV